MTLTYSQHHALIAARDEVRARLADTWRPITADRGDDWTSEKEAARMWAAANLAPVMTLDEFNQIDATCMGHVDWFSKLTLRVADRVVGL